MKKMLFLNAFIAILALLVGFGIGRKIYAPDERTTDAGGSVTESTGIIGDGTVDYFPPLSGSSVGTREGVQGAYTIEMQDQRPGTAVQITKLETPTDVWVAIHETQDGVPGNILGAARFRAGETDLDDVELLRPTAGEEQYIAMLHTDDGDDAFDFTKDVPLRSADGEVIMAIFRAVGSPTQR